MIYALYHNVACKNFDFNRDFAIGRVSRAEVLLKMQRGNVSCAKWARMPSRNEIREIVMDSDSDKEKYYASQESEDKEEPHPHS